MKKYICILLLSAAVCVCGCGSKNKLKDGFYTAEMSDYSHGWKEYVCIMVKNGTIVSAEFNAKDPNGYIKAWDNAYMDNMLSQAGTYPNAYTRYYTASLVEQQDISKVDTLSGATSSGGNFTLLSTAVIEQAKKGDHTVALVDQASEASGS